MPETKRAYLFGWQSNFQLNNFKPEKAVIKEEPRKIGAVLSIIIAFFIFLGLAFFLSFLNKKIESRKLSESQKLSLYRIEISLRV